MKKKPHKSDFKPDPAFFRPPVHGLYPGEECFLECPDSDYRWQYTCLTAFALEDEKVLGGPGFEYREAQAISFKPWTRLRTCGIMHGSINDANACPARKRCYEYMVIARENPNSLEKRAIDAVDE